MSDHALIDKTETAERQPPTEPANLRRRAARGGAVVVASRLALQLLSWSVTILVARFLRPFDYGVMTAGSILLELGDRLTEVGIGKAIVRRTELTREDVAEAFTLSLMLSWTMYAILFVLAVPASAYFRNPELVAYLRVVGVLTLMIPFRTVPLALLTRELRMERQSAIQAMSTGVQSMLVLSLAAAGFGYWALAVGAIVAKFVEIIALSRATGWRPRLKLPGRGSRDLVRFSAHITGAGLVWHAYSNMDYFILGRVSGAVVLGYYTLAFNLITLPTNRLTGNLTQVAFPVFCRLQHDPSRMWSWFVRFLSFIALLGLPAMVGLALVAGDAIPLLLGAKWQPAILPFQIMSLAGGVMVLGTAVTPMFNVINRPDLNLKFSLVCLVTMTPCFYVLSRSHGATGVALTWAVLYPIISAGRIWATRSITGVGLGTMMRPLAPIFAALGVMALAVLGVEAVVGGPEPSWTRLVAAISCGAVSYLGSIWIFGRQSILRDVKTLWRELRGR